MFKVGDKVRRKKEFLDSTFKLWFEETTNAPPPVMFTVADVVGGDIILTGIDGSWFSERFELAKKPKKYL